MDSRPEKKIVIVGNVLESARKNFKEILSSGSPITAKNVRARSERANFELAITHFLWLLLNGTLYPNVSRIAFQV
jgi:hypothetical protein